MECLNGSADQFWAQTRNGITLGAIYAMIALGYTMVYGIVRLINFAHGDVFMVGAFIGLYAIERFHLPLAAVVLLAVLGCSLLAIAMERVAYRPLRLAPKIASLTTGIGVSLFLEYFTALLQVFGPNFYSFPRPFSVTSWEVRGIVLTNNEKATGFRGVRGLKIEAPRGRYRSLQFCPDVRVFDL